MSHNQPTTSRQYKDLPRAINKYNIVMPEKKKQPPFTSIPVSKIIFMQRLAAVRAKCQARELNPGAGVPKSYLQPPDERDDEDDLQEGIKTESPTPQ